MPKAPHIATQIRVFPSHLFSNGSYAVQRSAREIEVWGANLSEHYTIRVNDIDDGSVDVIYLGFSTATQNHN
ncbi:MAG: hypothetical protein H0X31_01295 [Nostocaceae cyanobacterium]|nr:hypothetical protein [Nostocaceae cyanobacterium]